MPLCLIQETLFSMRANKSRHDFMYKSHLFHPTPFNFAPIYLPPSASGRQRRCFKAETRKPLLPTILRAAVDRGATLVASIGIKLQSRFRVRVESPALIITTCYKPLALKPSDKLFNNQNFKKALNLLHDIWQNFPSINTFKK